MKHLGVLFVIGVFGLAGTSTAASTLYAATKLGPFKSTDSGVTWKQLIVTSNDSSLPGEPEIFAMAVGLYAFARLGPNGQTLAEGGWPIQASIGGTLSPTGIVLSIAH